MVWLRVFGVVTVLVAITLILPIKCNQKLLLTIYYSSQCPACRTFFLKQLQPTVRSLQKYVKVRLVPFGKSVSVDYGLAGFECQHGPRECFGNLVQDCTLELMKSSNISDVQMVDYVTCDLKNYMDNVRDWDCVRNVSKVETEKVQQCVMNGKGTILQLDSEYFTSLVKPQFLPTVTLEGTFNQHFQDTAMSDLMGSLCSLLRHTSPCLHYFNDVAMKAVLGSSVNKNHVSRLRILK